ncbi:MAG TPA: hypothetical protein VMI54_26515 [Polyangiaceae bacterium]|nr:hypothetical protein [Polyangiaceae bacterium]
MSLRLGAETARDRLVGARPWLFVSAAAGVVAAIGGTERTDGASGADRALLGVTLPFVVPLVCDALFELALGRSRTSALLEPLARHGADRRTLALGALLTLTLACALATALLAVIAVGSATTLSAALVRELDASAWGGALAGAAYGGLLAVGSLRGRAGRLWVLAGDFFFGSGSGPFAVPWPRGHARNLLGGTPVLEGSPSFAALMLALLAASYLSFTASRGPS